MMAATKPKRELPSKEAALFKQVLVRLYARIEFKNGTQRLYEHKQYKKGLKSAEQILKKFPEHGETLAMKGLFLSHVGSKDDAYDYVKKGLKSWHVYGLLYRSDKNYEEAMKCYRHALKYDKENIQVLRDFSFLQIQMRDYEGFNETQHELLRLRPAQRVYWIGLALSYHLMKKNKTACEILDAYQGTAKDREQGAMDFEHSELQLYRNFVLEESGQLDEALAHLDKIEGEVCDKRRVQERRAAMLLALGRNDEAEQVYRKLFEENVDSSDYLNGLMASLRFKKEEAADHERIHAFIKSLIQEHPRSNLIKRMPLLFSTGETFRKDLEDYVQPMLRKNVPSLFVSLKTLYADPSKVQMIQSVMESYLDVLSTSGYFHAGEQGEKENPSVVLYVLYFLAQHYDQLHQYTKAMAFIDRAIEHTPTLLELIMFKARIFKHAGNHDAAADWMDDARSLDLQDRFINTKATKYLLRADKVEEAQSTIALFAKQGDFTEKMADLVEMQCMWFAMESAESHIRQGQYGLALKKFHQIQKHFEDITDDQFDFHTYCLRKLTMRSYISLLRLEDEVYTSKPIVRATENAVRCYLALFDDPALKDAKSLDDMANLSSAEKKKLLSKQRRAAAREKEQTEAQKTANGSSKAPAVKDDDPNGQKYLEADPLSSALNFLRPMMDQATELLSTHVLCFEVFWRQKKYLLALKSLKQCQRIDSDHPDTHTCFIRFWHSIATLPEGVLSPTSQTLIEEERLRSKTLRGNILTTLCQLNQTYQDQAQSSGHVSRFIAGCKMMLHLNPEAQTQAQSLLVSIPTQPQFLHQSAAPLQDKLTPAMANALTKDLTPENKVSFISACKRQFPLSSYFMTAEEAAEAGKQWTTTSKTLEEAVRQMSVQ